MCEDTDPKAEHRLEQSVSAYQKSAFRLFTGRSVNTKNFVVSKPASTKKAANIYSWLERICCGLKPFNFVENELTRKYCNFAPIAENTAKKYMENVTKEVEVLIKTKLPNRFVPVIDGWSKSSTHFVGVFASYSCENNLGYESALLSFSPLLTETSFNARDHYEYFEWVLRLYNKIFRNVVCNCGDNAEVNKAIANLCNLPLLGCNSHQLNLAVKEFTKTSSNLLEKVNNLTIKLRGLKLSGKLRKTRSKTLWQTPETYRSAACLQK